MDLSKYLGLFVAEAREHLSEAEEILARPDPLRSPPESLRDLLRHAHSIKGMAGSMGYQPMAELSHAVESLLDACRRGELDPGSDHVALVGDALACLDRMVSCAEQGAPVADDEAAVIAARLEESRASAPAAPLPVASNGPPESAPLSRIRLEIALDRDAPALPVQAAMVLGRLARLGRVLRSDPPPAALRLGRMNGLLEVLVESERPPEDLERELLSADAVVSVRAEALPPRPTPAGQVSPAPSTLRVRSDLLDAVLERVLDLTFEQERLAASLRASRDRAAAERSDRCQALVRALHADVMEMRLVGFDAVARRLSHAVRDLARRLGKQVRFAIEGRDVRMDRSMLEGLADPLLHMVRNAVDHGVEPPDARRAAGKGPEGRITLSLERRADRIRITLDDDGRGLDAAALRVAAVERGLLRATDAARLTEAESLMLATLPGFSTATRLTDVSGRGVGLDAARAGIEALGGRLAIRSTPGEGASMSIALPMTLAVVQTLLVRSAGQLFALPASAVERMLPRGEEPSPTPRAAADADAAPVVVRLDERLGLGAEPRPARDAAVLLCPVGDRGMALVVDEVLGRRDVVVKPLRPPLGLLKEYSGAALLDDGSVVLVLDPAALPE